MKNSTGGASTFYRFVAKLRAEREAGADPIIRFEGLPGEYVQWDSGEARIPLGGTLVKRVFLAGRLKYSRVSAVRWRAALPALRENATREHPRPPQEVAHPIRELSRKSGALQLRISMLSR